MRSLPLRVPALLLALASPALASDGVLEINQTCAVQTGCFAGDTAALPVTINGSAGHSYRLTSDLAVPNENTHGIQISTDNVSIDLAGFEIRGPVVCSGTPLACVPANGTGSGVDTTSSLLLGHSVRNGSIRGMGDDGIQLGSQSEVTNLRIRSNRRDGITVGRGSIVSRNTTYQNGDTGIDCTGRSTVSENTVYLNGGQGIGVGAGSTISGNTANENGTDGIGTQDGSIVTGNTLRGNQRFGLVVDVQSGYRENVISGNTAGTVSGAGVNLGNNLCNGSLTCP